MAKIHLDRIRRKYGWRGGKYQALMAVIIERQTGMISRRIAEIQKKKLDAHARTALRRAGQTLTVPDITEVLPKRSVFIRKGAERGKLLTDNLRDSLTRSLRESVIRFIAEGKDTMQGRRGARRGRINNALVTEFEGKIRKTFAAYAKRDPEIGVPANVATIATTEVRSVIDQIKHDYNVALAARNAGAVRTVKKWRNHPELSKNPRPGHAAVSGKTAPLGTAFRVPLYERIGTVKSGPNKGRPRWKKLAGEVVEMQHPHDPAAPIGEVADCHCELDYNLEVVPLTPRGRRA